MVPRGAPREQAILGATIELLTEASYESLTVDAVAARARCSKTTIYRRWSGKAELVRAAIENYQSHTHPALPDTGSLRGDLMTMLRAARSQATPEFRAMMGGLIQAMRTDDEPRRLLWPQLVDDSRPFKQIIERGVQRGETPRGTCPDLAHEVTEALVLRRMALNLPWDDEFLRHLTDDILLPMLTKLPAESDRSVE